MKKEKYEVKVFGQKYSVRNLTEAHRFASTRIERGSAVKAEIFKNNRKIATFSKA